MERFRSAIVFIRHIRLARKEKESKDEAPKRRALLKKIWSFPKWAKAFYGSVEERQYDAFGARISMDLNNVIAVQKVMYNWRKSGNLNSMHSELFHLAVDDQTMH